MSTTPQDKPKAEAAFTFKAKVPGKDGKPVTKTFTLPPITTEAAGSVPGEITYAAIMSPDDDMAQLRLAFATLEAAKPAPAALAALKSLPHSEMLGVVYDWMGESSGSSD